MERRQRINMAEIKLTDNEINAALCVLRSGGLRQDKVCLAFEQAFAQMVGARHAITCSSGTAALHLAYMAFLQPGDEVLVPSFTFIATGSMVTAAGGRPVFCDVDPKTYLIDLQDAKTKITQRTKAIAPVHLFGNACDVRKIQSFALSYHLITVWDAAQAHGAEYEGKDVGSYNDFVCYSFYPSKNVFVGEGGMITTDSDVLAEKIRLLRTHGQAGKYYHTLMGLNYRMTDVEAAIGLEQLKRLDSMLERRRRNGRLLSYGLSEIPGLMPQQHTQNGEHAYHQYCVVVDPHRFGLNRNQLANYLAEKGIATGVHYPRGLHQQPVFLELYGEISLPVTEYLAANILALPVHHGLSDEDIELIVSSVFEAID